MKYREACATRDGAKCDDVYWNEKASMKFTSIEEVMGVMFVHQNIEQQYGLTYKQYLKWNQWSWDVL